MRMRHILIWFLSGSSISFHLVSSQRALFSKNIIVHKVCFLILSAKFFEKFAIMKRYDKIYMLVFM